MAYPMKLPAGEPILTVTNRKYAEQSSQMIEPHQPWSNFPAKPFLWIIELHNGQDNRLTSILIRDGILPALHAVERSWRQAWRTARATSDQNGGKGALIVVGRRDQDKFFSNGEIVLTFCKLVAYFVQVSTSRTFARTRISS